MTTMKIRSVEKLLTAVEKDNHLGLETVVFKRSAAPWCSVKALQVVRAHEFNNEIFCFYESSNLCKHIQFRKAKVISWKHQHVMMHLTNLCPILSEYSKCLPLTYL